jgi:MFS family permease
MLLIPSNNFPERTRKLNIWAFMFLVGPYLGPLISSFLLSKISWRLDMGILAIFYAVSTVLVVILGEETLYDREKTVNPTEGASHVSLLIGVAGFKAKGQTTMASVSKHLLQIFIRPQLLLPCK